MDLTNLFGRSKTEKKDSAPTRLPDVSGSTSDPELDDLLAGIGSQHETDLAERDALIADLRGQLTALKQQEAERSSETARLRNERDQFKTGTDTLQTSLKQIQEKSAREVEEARTAAARQVQTLKEQAQKQIDVLRTEGTTQIEKLRIDLETEKKARAGAIEQIGGLQTQLAARDAAIAELKADNDRLRKTGADTEAKLAQAIHERDAADAAVQQAQAQYAAMKDRLRGLGKNRNG